MHEFNRGGGPVNPSTPSDAVTPGDTAVAKPTNTGGKHFEGELGASGGGPANPPVHDCTYIESVHVSGHGNSDEATFEGQPLANHSHSSTVELVQAGIQEFTDQPRPAISACGDGPPNPSMHDFSSLGGCPSLKFTV